MRFLCKVPRWSMLVAPLFYLIFVLFVLNLTFPLSSLAQRSGFGGGGAGRRSSNSVSAAAQHGIENRSSSGGSVDSYDDAANAVAYKVEPKQHTYEELRTLKESFYK